MGNLFLEGPKGALFIKKNDKLTRKIAMLIENICFGEKVVDVIKKYGFSRSRFYQILDNYKTGGSEALIEHKRGPTRKSVRNDIVIGQIIRHRFLDSDAGADVITQKLKQNGYNVSQRSVERTITEYGIQKKTPSIKSSKKV